MKVQRYMAEPTDCGDSPMEKDENGDWIYFEDYDFLVEALQQVKDATNVLDACEIATLALQKRNT